MRKQTHNMEKQCRFDTRDKAVYSLCILSGKNAHPAIEILHRHSFHIRGDFI